MRNDYPGDTDRSVASYYYLGPKTERNYALALIITKLLNDNSILEKYGYSQIYLHDSFESSIGLVFTVNIRQLRAGDQYTPLFVDKQIEFELRTLNDKINDITNSTFIEMYESMAAEVLRY